MPAFQTQGRLSFESCRLIWNGQSAIQRWNAVCMEWKISMLHITWLHLKKIMQSDNLKIMNPSHIYSFKSYILHGRSPLSRTVIEIDDTCVTMKQKQYPFSALKSISIPLQNIINIEVNKQGIGASILIQSYAKSRIFCKGLSIVDARKIKSLISG